jgi:hypothetical protein
MNREEGFSLNKSWMLIIQTLKEHKQVLWGIVSYSLLIWLSSALVLLRVSPTLMLLPLILPGGPGKDTILPPFPVGFHGTVPPPVLPVVALKTALFNPTSYWPRQDSLTLLYFLSHICVHFQVPVTSSCRWRQHSPLKHSYPILSYHITACHHIPEDHDLNPHHH